MKQAKFTLSMSQGNSACILFSAVHLVASRSDSATSMSTTFDLRKFLTCPQGPRLEGEARADACNVLGHAIVQGRVMTAAHLLMQDPSLIREKLYGYPEEYDDEMAWAPAAQMSMDAGLDAFVLFALAHGMSVTDTRFGASRGLLTRATSQNLPGLVSCALLYGADPNQLASNKPGVQQETLLDQAIREVFSVRSKPSEFFSAVQIVHMLLDAGANPALPGAANTAFDTLCRIPWEESPELRRIFTEILKRTTTFENVCRSELLISGAIPARNFDAAMALAVAGAPFNAAEIDRISKKDGSLQDIADFAAVIRQHHKSAAPTVSSGQTAQPNLAPDGFLAMTQGARLEGRARADACHLLDMAIAQGRFVTATKLLSMDPSLITESLGEDGLPKQPAMKKAIASEMTALVPFALEQGMRVDDPAFGASGGLLNVGIKRSSIPLMSYAILHRADPNQLPVSAAKRNAPPGTLTFLDKVIKRACNLPVTKFTTTRDLWTGTMLLDAGASPCVPGAANIALQQLCKINWSTTTKIQSLREIFSAMLKRGGATCVDMRLDNMPALRLAAESRNIDAVTQLVEAGACTDTEFLGVDLFKLFKDIGMGEHIPALTEIMIRRQIAQGSAASLDPTVVIVAGPGEHDAADPRPRKLTASHVF